MHDCGELEAEALVPEVVAARAASPAPLLAPLAALVERLLAGVLAVS
ncbi:hypothetical protein [Deinococcus yavapaiensis]|nr:hypothetical protein [Deinococcus yavapaiensis]